MARKMFSLGAEEKVLTKCPICGAALEYIELGQYEEVYGITKKGSITKRRKRKKDIGPMEAAFIACTNAECNFHTNCELEAEDHMNIHIYQSGDMFIYTDE